MRICLGLLLLLAVSLINIRSAHAGTGGTQCGANDGTVYPGCDQGTAFAECKTAFAALKVKYPRSTDTYPCTPAAGSTAIKGSYRCELRDLDFSNNRSCGVPGAAPYFNYAGGCTARPDAVLRQNMSVFPTVKATECSKGCAYTVNPKATECFTVEDQPGTSDDAAVGHNCRFDIKASGATCSDNDPPDKPPPELPGKCEGAKTRLPNGDCVDRGNCPIGQHMVAGKCTPDGACPTGKIKAPDGSCIDEQCPEGQVKASDGTCKKDDDGDGEPNEGEDTGKFSGGDDCKNPPQCSGDNILCGQARIQWRIDCNTRRASSVNGGNGCGMGDVPICAGEHCDPLEYSGLLQAWRTRCAIEGLATGTPSTGDPAAGQIRDFLVGTGQSVPSAPDPWITENLEPASWSAGLGQGSCPPPIETNITVTGHSAPVSFSFQPICDFAVLLRSLLLACSAIVSLTIIAGARK